MHARSISARRPLFAAARPLIGSLLAAVCCVLGLIAAPSSAATPAALTKPVPSVRSFEVRPSALSSAGGRLVIKGSVRHSVTCRIVASPPLRGFPRILRCAGGRVALRVLLPRNRGRRTLHEKFTLSARTSRRTLRARLPPRSRSIRRCSGRGHSKFPQMDESASSTGSRVASIDFCMAIDNSTGNVVNLERVPHGRAGRTCRYTRSQFPVPCRLSA